MGKFNIPPECELYGKEIDRLLDEGKYGELATYIATVETYGLTHILSSMLLFFIILVQDIVSLQIIRSKTSPKLLMYHVFNIDVKHFTISEKLYL